MAPKPCPYRKEHEWEWEPARQTWMCSVCFAVCENPSTAIAKPTEEKPTPAHPFMAIGPKASLVCAIPNCNSIGQMVPLGSSRWATRCRKHSPRWRLQED